MKLSLQSISPRLLFYGLSLLLLMLACTWQLPMIMYDHLDLIPVLEQFKAGNLSMEKMLAWHGGHNHLVAYLVLLFTSQLSNGWLMADILASWIFLLAYSGVMCLCIHRIQMGPGNVQRRLLLLVTIAMTLSTLHLPNLIWGWQVAVFINLFGLSLGVAAVCLTVPWVARLLLGVAGMVLAVSSFATGIVLFPAMVTGIVMRREISNVQKASLVVIWAVLLSWLMYHLDFFSEGVKPGKLELAGIIVYTFNYLGGGIVRFATLFSFPVVIFGLAMLWIALRDLFLDSRRLAALWSMVAVFGFGAALLTAYGRYDMYGAHQAWVIRYGSFAGLLWFAVIGAMTSAGYWRHENRLRRIGLKALTFMFVFNSLHFIPQARDFSDDAHELAHTAQREWPEVAPDVLASLYPTDPAVAVRGLQYLHDHRYPPFRDERTSRGQ